MRSVLHIGAVHGNDVGRRLRIGEYPDADARTRQLFKRIREFLARNEIGGNNIHRTRWFRQQRHKLWEKQILDFCFPHSLARVIADQGNLGPLERQPARLDPADEVRVRSEEHTSELQSLMRISYAVFFLKKKKQHTHTP